MAFSNPSYVAKVGIPGTKGSLSIAHSTMSHCPSTADTAIKVVDGTVNDFNLKEPIQGLTIHVFFQHSNKVFSNDLKLQIGNNTTPIIHSMAYGGTSYSDKAIFQYPQQHEYSMITFVYKALTGWINGIEYTSNNPYYVQQAINTDPVQSVFPNSLTELPKKKDFNDEIQTQAGTVEINNLYTMTNRMDISNGIGGILEIIPVRDSLIIQRVVTVTGEIYQREKFEDASQTPPVIRQSDWVKMATSAELSAALTNVWTKNELPHTLINMPENVIMSQLPAHPETGNKIYNVYLQSTPTGYEFTFNET